MGGIMSKDQYKQNRQELLIDLYGKYLINEITMGQLIAYLRKNILDMSQDEYADFVGISRRTLTNIEQDNGKLTQSILNKVFKPLGLKVGIIPIHEHVIRKIFNVSDEK